VNWLATGASRPQPASAACAPARDPERGFRSHLNACNGRRMAWERVKASVESARDGWPIDRFLSPKYANGINWEGAMHNDASHSSKYVTINGSTVEINHCIFDSATLAEASTYDESGKAKRWAKFGIVGGAVITALNLIPGLSVRPGPLFVVPMVFGGVALLLYKLRPALGAGLVLTLKDGSASIVKGIPRRELPNVVAVVEKLIAPKITPEL
jgi:hypothetical protein